MNEHIEKLIQLAKENPELQIRMIVNSYLGVDADSYKWWMGKIEKIEIDIYWFLPKCFYIGKDEIIDQINCNMEDEPEFEDLYDEEYDKILQKEFDRLKNSGEIKKAILVFIND
jgi:hypothetical protein